MSATDIIFIIGIAGTLFTFLVLAVGAMHYSGPWWARVLFCLWAFSQQAAMLALASRFN